MPIVGGGISSNTWPSANLAIYVPFRLSERFTFNSLTAVVGTTAGNLDMGVYSADGTRIISTGSTAVGSSNQTISVASTTIGPGLFYFALACSSVTAAFYSYKMTATAAAGLLRTVGIMQQATALPLPATATFAANTGTVVPIMGITARSFV